jgi:hypothetical protein
MDFDNVFSQVSSQYRFVASSIEHHWAAGDLLILFWAFIFDISVRERCPTHATTVSGPVRRENQPGMSAHRGAQGKQTPGIPI